MTAQQTSPLDDSISAVLARAEASSGNGPDDFAAVLEATLAAGAVSAELARPFVSRLWFTPWRFDPGARVVARESEWLAATSPVRLDVDHWHLAGYEAGSGPTVLLLHGWGDCASRLGAFVQPLVDRGLGVLAVDLPGHGGSGNRPADLYQLTDAISAVAAARGVRGVVAHSLGGQAVVRALRHLPGVGAAVLLAPAVRIETTLATFTEMFALPRLAVQGLRDDIEGRYGRGTWADLDSRRQAEHLQIPGLIVHSADDEQIPARDIGLLAGAWKQAQLLRLDGLGHSRILRDPGVTTRAADFLARHLVVGPRPV